MASRHNRRPDRNFLPLHPLGGSNVTLEPRFLAAGSLRSCLAPPFELLVLVDSMLAQSRPQGQPLTTGVPDTPGFMIIAEPGIFSLSRDPQSVTNPGIADDTSNGTEDAVANIGGSLLPPAFTGQMGSTVDTNNTLETPAAGQTDSQITVTFGMQHHIQQNTTIQGGVWMLGLLSIVGSGVGNNGGPPAPITWGFVDTSVPGDPGWGTVRGNPPVYLTGNININHASFVGNGGFDPPSTSAFPVLSGTGVWFTSAATGILIEGPVTDPNDGAPLSLEYIYPTVTGGVTTLHPPQYSDGFFATTDSSNTVNISYSALTTAAGETVSYIAELSTAFATSPVTLNGGSDSMGFTFNEHVGTLS